MRNVNFTKRVKLSGSDVKVRRLRPVDGRLAFDLHTDFTRLKKQHSAELINTAILATEIYIGSRTERVDCGTVSAAKLTGHISQQFREDDRVLFRFKVIDSQVDPGRLLGLRSMMRSGQDDNPHGSLLGFDVRPLDGVPFKIEFASQSEPPVLVLNSALCEDDAARVKLFARTNGTFLSIVLPAAAREILTYYVLIEKNQPTEADSPPQPWDMWYRFAEQFSGEAIASVLQDDSSRHAVEWIDDVVGEMAKDWKAVQRLREAVLEG